MNQEIKLELEVTDHILEVANMSTDVCTSDLQGIAQAKAKELIKDLKKLWGV